ncbi:MAG: hypothetical protein JNM56_02375 [Planctomycetia bacterium]|nr:hypothetical protein [Planctomycetia bacterium]
MRGIRSLVLVGLFLLVGLVLAESTHGQSPVFPQGRTVVFGKGALPTQIVNVPIDTGNSIVPVPGQQVGFFMPAFRKFMRAGSNPTFNGVSAVPNQNQYPGAVFPQFAPAINQK